MFWHLEMPRRILWLPPLLPAPGARAKVYNQGFVKLFDERHAGAFGRPGGRHRIRCVELAESLRISILYRQQSHVRKICFFRFVGKLYADAF